MHINDWTVIPIPSLDEPHPGLELVHGVEDQLPAVVALVVGDLDLLKANDLLLQLICCEGTIRMTVETVGWSRVCLSRNQPWGSVIGVSVSLVVTWGDIQDNMVLYSWLLFNIIEGDSDSWEHSPSSSGDDHFCAKFSKFVPKVLVVQVTRYTAQVLTVAFFTNFTLLDFSS